MEILLLLYIIYGNLFYVFENIFSHESSNRLLLNGPDREKFSI